MVGSPEECCKLRVCIETNRSIPYNGVFRWKSGGAPFRVPLGGSPGPHEGRFSKRMFQLNSRHQDEAMDTKLDVFL